MIFVYNFLLVYLVLSLDYRRIALVLRGYCRGIRSKMTEYKTENMVAYNLRIPDDLKRRLEEIARKEKRSLNGLLVYMVIPDWIEKYEKEVK